MNPVLLNFFGDDTRGFIPDPRKVRMIHALKQCRPDIYAALAARQPLTEEQNRYFGFSWSDLDPFNPDSKAANLVKQFDPSNKDVIAGKLFEAFLPAKQGSGGGGGIPAEYLWIGGGALLLVLILTMSRRPAQGAAIPAGA